MFALMISEKTKKEDQILLRLCKSLTSDGKL